MSATQDAHNPLVLTGRTEHLEQIKILLTDRVRHLFVLKGGLGKKRRAQLMSEMGMVAPDEPRVVLATGSYVGEGFDDSRLDTLFLAMPISWRGTLQQYVGRLHRLHEGKRMVRVYDCIDGNVPMLARMFERRLDGLQSGRDGSPPEQVMCAFASVPQARRSVCRVIPNPGFLEAGFSTCLSRHLRSIEVQSRPSRGRGGPHPR